MPRLPLIAVVALSVVAATVSSAQDGTRRADAATLEPVTDIEWSSLLRARNGEGRPYLHFQHDGMNTMLGADDLPEAEQVLADLSSAAPGDPISFSLTREAGALACAVRLVTAELARGTCRFDPDEGFVNALAARGLVPDDVEELLALAFVDARLASFDDLSRAGFAVTTVDELMTVAALEVTGAYALELRDAGLRPEDLDELVSAKAVGVEPGWIAEMAEAGYPGLDLHKVIELRALGVTPDYARRMAQVMRAMEGVE